METYNYHDNRLLVIREEENFNLVGRVNIKKRECFSVYKDDVIKINREFYKIIDFSEEIEHDTIVEKTILVKWIESIREFEVED
ncbi:TPA: hypothetical protein N2D99_002271 [Clostridium botulinum]|nr:hypothetical protein [Clostridium botulinum]